MKPKFKFTFKPKRDSESGPRLDLARLFAGLGGLSLLGLVGSAWGLYTLAIQGQETASVQGSRQVAETAAAHLSHVLALSGGVLEQQAQDPDYARILGGGEPDRIHGAEERLTRALPEALLVRLLPDGLDTPDEQRAPHMGYADLDMVRQAASKPMPPTLHAANTPDAHIALAKPLAGGNGVVLASLAPKLATAALPKLDRGGLELKQQNLSLAFQGETALKSTPPDGTVPVPGTPWTLAYWGARADGTELPWFLGYAGLAALLVVAGVYLAQRWAIAALRHDQDNIVLMVRDTLSGKGPRRYPFRLKDTLRLALQLEQLKGPPPVPQAPSESGLPAPLPTPPADVPFNPFAIALGEPEITELPAVEVPAAAATPTAPAISLDPALFRTYDILGTAGANLSAETMQLLGRAIGSEIRERGEYTVVMGRDGRASSLELAQALGRGLTASGCSVIDVGRVPTPALYFALHALGLESGVMLTGGDAPSDQNGLKLLIGGERPDRDGLLKLKERVEHNQLASGTGMLEAQNILQDYVESIVHDTQLGREMKVVIDCGNGVTGFFASDLFQEIGCQVLPLYTEVDGTFPNHFPDPSQAGNLATLIRAVRQERADLGLAFDSDGDRLGVVDSSGKIIWPDQQMMLFAADVLSRQPGSDIVFDAQCTRHLASHIVRNGGRPLMWKVGAVPLHNKLKETGALLAGDLAGHFFFKERWSGFEDGLYAAARLLEILSGDPRPTAQVFAELPESVKLPELRINMSHADKPRFLEKVRAQAEFTDARITDIDGLRVDFADGWGLVRDDPDSPTLALRFEADNPDTLLRIQGEFKTLLQKVKPKLSFPLSLSERPDP